MTNTADMKFRDASLPIGERVADLVSRMTLDEKIAHLSEKSPAIERLGVPAFSFHGECLHGLVNRGEATCFPQAIGLAATFDPALVQRIAGAIGREARAKFHDPIWNNPKAPAPTLAFWSPVINVLRDPRWGRAQETYGEDPHLISQMGAAFVRGLQGDHPRYLQATACAKHLGAHSGPERLRRSFNAVVSLKDLHETYLPAFRALVEAGAESVMTTYNRVNGVHCCASPFLIQEFLRGQCGFQGHVDSDGGALGSLHTSHGITKDALETAVVCLKAGCDMDVGMKAYPELPKALEQGFVTMADIDRAVGRLLATRFKLGLFDDPQTVPYAKIRSDVIVCKKHVALAREAAVKSIVLLKNNGILPLGPDKRAICVMGPNAADLQVLVGNFYRTLAPRLVSILEGVLQAAPKGTVVTHMPGCFAAHPNLYDSTWHNGLAEWADAVVAVMGITPLMEGENGECIGSSDGGERDTMGLPAHQLAALRETKKVGKPIVLVLTGGSPICEPELEELADAILYVWYPGQEGGAAVGDVLFGRQSPSGRLPVTVPRSIDQLPAYEDYAMKGRTYRYMTGEPLYPFGFGLSYTRFEYGPMELSKRRVKPGQSLRATVEVKNAGPRTADPRGTSGASVPVGVSPRSPGNAAEEVVQLYLTDDAASTATPRWALKAFQRIRLKPGQSKKVRFTITPEMMRLINDNGEAVLEPGTFTVTIGGACPHPRAQALGAPAPAVGRFELT